VASLVQSTANFWANGRQPGSSQVSIGEVEAGPIIDRGCSSSNELDWGTLHFVVSRVFVSLNYLSAAVKKKGNSSPSYLVEGFFDVLGNLDDLQDDVLSNPLLQSRNLRLAECTLTILNKEIGKRNPFGG